MTPTTTGTTSTSAVVAMLRCARNGSITAVSAAMQVNADSDPMTLRRVVALVQWSFQLAAVTAVFDPALAVVTRADPVWR